MCKFYIVLSCVFVSDNVWAPCFFSTAGDHLALSQYGQYCDIFFLGFCVDEDFVLVANSLVVVINNALTKDSNVIPN